MKFTKIFLPVLILCLFACQNLFAAGLDSSTIGAKGYAMGKAFTGVADDSSAIFYNPGGQGFLEDGLYAQVAGMLVFSDFKYETPLKSDTCSESTLMPSVFVTYKTGEMAFGLGFYIPYGGGGTAYENFQNVADLESSLGIYAITPSFAYQLSSDISIGVALSAYFGYMTTLATIDMGLPVLVEVDSEYSGFAGFGGNIGLMLNLIEDLNIGLTLRSPVSVSMNGSLSATIPGIGTTKADSTMEFKLPLYITFGLAYQLTPEFLIAFGADIQFWSMMKEYKATTSTTSGDEVTKLETYYSDGYSVNLGFDYIAIEGFAIRGGSSFSRTPTPLKGLNPVSNDVSHLTFIAGIAYWLTSNVEVDLSFNYGIGFGKEYNSQKFDRDFMMILAGIRVKLGKSQIK